MGVTHKDVAQIGLLLIKVAQVEVAHIVVDQSNRDKNPDKIFDFSNLNSTITPIAV